MQVILGAGGAIGTPLAKVLTNYTQDIRLVNRHPEKVNPTDTLFTADLLNEADVVKAVEGADVAYLTVGLPYKKHVWQQAWPKVMAHTINACAAANCKLVFFDNVYMYDPHHLDGMDEHTPIGPVSVKGRVRAQIAQELLLAIEEGKIEGMIARAADFIGATPNAIPHEVILKNLISGKSAQWFGRKDKVHNFTYVEDAAKAVAELGNTPSAYGRVWHLPSTQQRLTGADWVQLFAGELEVKPKLSVLPVSLMGIVGWFIPIMKEIKEMAYQYNRDYFFDSSSFTRTFGWSATDEQEIVKTMIAQYKADNQ